MWSSIPPCEKGPQKTEYREFQCGYPSRDTHTHTFVPFLGENAIYLLAGRPIKNQSGCLECAGNGKAEAVKEVRLINRHFHLVA